MILFPAIDLIGGKVVRLERGDRSRCKVYSDDPIAVAHEFAAQGAAWLHVVDLSAAFEEDEAAREANSRSIKAICQVDGLSIDVGGGVRSLARIDELAGYGAKRIAMGTVLVTEPGLPGVPTRLASMAHTTAWLPNAAAACVIKLGSRTAAELRETLSAPAATI